MTPATMRIRQAAEYLGETEATIRSRISRGTLPYRRLGGRIVLIKAELDNYLASLPGVTPEQAKENLHPQ